MALKVKNMIQIVALLVVRRWTAGVFYHLRIRPTVLLDSSTISYVSHFSRVFCLTLQIRCDKGSRLKNALHPRLKWMIKKERMKTKLEPNRNSLYIYSIRTIKVFAKKTLYMLMTLKLMSLAMPCQSSGCQTTTKLKVFHKMDRTFRT